MLVENSIYADTGRLIRNARKAKRMTQARLAAAVGMSRGSIANIERGRQKLLLHTLSVLARALDLGFHELLPAQDKTELPLEQKLPKDVTAKERAWINRLLAQGTKTS